MNNDVELIPVKGVLPSVQVQSDNVIYVPQAHKNKAGIVKEGDGVLIENGVVSLNKQTVEDMIDANKWVSYGFKQNLTEDEKGMARHNIGAGDNYFTGSYYDLTQKPHLNTNNITGLDYGDEELNDTINLHKISKTGSFNDLKHVPQETLDFAESERQKSKNLFTTQNNNKYGSHATYNIINSNSFSLSYGSGNVTWSGVEFIINNLKPNTTYNFSLICDVSYGTLYFQFIGLNTVSEIFSVYGGYLRPFNTGDNTSIKIRVSSGNNNLENETFNITNVQLEEGSVATEYQPYNGAIVHEKDVSDVEHIETIYDMSSSDSNINLGYTSGILFNSSSTYTFENLKSKYKGVYITVKIYADTNRVKFYLSLTDTINRSSFLGVDANVSNNDICYGTIYFENNGLHPVNCARHSFANTSGTITSLNDNERYCIIAIEGVLK